MKGRIATVLSLTGVLVAGSAAALVNTQVLQNSSSRSSTQVLAPDATDPATAPAATDPQTTTMVHPAPIASVVTTAPAGTQAAYQVGEAGTVTLDTVGDRLTLVSAVPNAGWVLVSAANDDALHVEAVFSSATTTIEFHAGLLFGVVSTSVEVQEPATSTTTPHSGGGTVTTAPHHDDDHGGTDDHGGDDHHGTPGTGGEPSDD